MPSAALSVYSTERAIDTPAARLPKALKLDKRLSMDGLHLLSQIPDDAIAATFLDPQYRGILDKLAYGNEGEGRSQRRCALEQMDDDTIAKFVSEIDRVLIPSGHLFLWMDKYHLCNGYRAWLEGTDLSVVDLINWNKDRIGMGYRTRRTTEYCIIAQKAPRRAKGVWQVHNIPDTWTERVPRDSKKHPHNKPVAMQAALIAAVSNEGDIILDPAAGTFSVMDAALAKGRRFLGCDLNG